MLRAPPRSYPARSPRRGAVLGDGRPGTMNLNYPAFADPQRAFNVTMERGQIRSPRLTEAQRHGEVLPPVRRSPRGGYRCVCRGRSCAAVRPVSPCRVEVLARAPRVSSACNTHHMLRLVQ